MLRAHKVRSRQTAPEDLVFASRTGGPMDHRSVAERGLARVYKRAELDGRAPTFHELRHAHASAWIATGGDMVELSAPLRRRDPRWLPESTRASLRRRLEVRSDGRASMRTGIAAPLLSAVDRQVWKFDVPPLVTGIVLQAHD